MARPNDWISLGLRKHLSFIIILPSALHNSVAISEIREFLPVEEDVYGYSRSDYSVDVSHYSRNVVGLLELSQLNPVLVIFLTFKNTFRDEIQDPTYREGASSKSS